MQIQGTTPATCSPKHLSMDPGLYTGTVQLPLRALILKGLKEGKGPIFRDSSAGLTLSNEHMFQ